MMALGTTDMENCIKACASCATVCARTLGYCLEKGGEHAKKGHIMLLLDCAKTCNIAASFMVRDSKFSKDMCRLCADICRACADDCASFKDPKMDECAQACRDCASECEKMSGG